MRGRILEILRAGGQEPVSGEELSRQLDVSRTAVWKHIQALRLKVMILNRYLKRLCLKSAPDRLKPAEIITHLKTKWLGHSIHYCESVDSTNNVAKRLAEEGCDNGLVVVSEEQRGGKGRLSRGWFSPFACGDWFSVVLNRRFCRRRLPNARLWLPLQL